MADVSFHIAKTCHQVKVQFSGFVIMFSIFFLWFLGFDF